MLVQKLFKRTFVLKLSKLDVYDFYAQNSATVVNPSYQIYTYISIWSLLLFTIKDGQSCWDLPIQQRGKTIDPHKTKCVGIFRRKKKSLLSFLLIYMQRLGKQKLWRIEKDLNLCDTWFIIELGYPLGILKRFSVWFL